ncbi:hypothetical protein TNCV_3276501 [Trichonephila clavipes]|nr:hypothetical protein TNCV_3276501 [Trichonephila clavipes]
MGQIGRVVAYRASTPQVLSSSWARSTQSHPISESINKYQACLGTKTLGGVASDRPLDRDISSCISAPNGHVYRDRHSGP